MKSMNLKCNSMTKATLMFIILVVTYNSMIISALAQFDPGVLPDPVANGPVEEITPGGGHSNPIQRCY